MLKQSPFPSWDVFLRVLLKALILVALINTLLLALHVDPIRRLVTLNTWDALGRGRARLAYPSDFQNGQLPLEALLSGHAISAAPKSSDEYRMILLGESGIAGWGVPDEATLAGQINALNIEHDGKRVIAYNLAYPQPSAARDTLILDAAMQYQPDLVIWFMTPAALNNAPDIAGANRVFFNLNRERLQAVVDQHPDLLAGWYEEHAPDLIDASPASDRFIAIRNQDLLPVWLNSLLYPFVAPDLAHSDRRMGLEPTPEEAHYILDTPGFEMPNDTWNFLMVGCLRVQTSGADLLLINEPMLIGTGPNAEVNYNPNYSRDLYDRYREVLPEYADKHGMRYVDLWDIVTAERFTDTPLHMDGEGYAILSAAVRDVITQGNQKSTCSR